MLQIPQNLCTEITDEQASTVQGGLFVVIRRIEAVQAGADGGIFGGATQDDDTYLKIDGTTVYGPKSFVTGKTREDINVGREVGSSAKIELFDEDKGGLFRRGQDDYLGGFTVSSPTNDGTATVSGSGSTYNVYYEAFNL